MRRNAIRTSKEAARPRRPPSRLPHLFGQGGRDRALIALAVNGPMHVRALGRAIGSDSRPVWHMDERLREAGLVVKRDRAGGRKYVAINKRLPVYQELLGLLFALDERWPSTRVEQPTYRWAMWDDDRSMFEDHMERTFQSVVRSRILLYVAAAGTTNMQDMYESLGMGSVSALYAVNHWERERIIRTVRSGRNRVVLLDARFEARCGASRAARKDGPLERDVPQGSRLVVTLMPEGGAGSVRTPLHAAQQKDDGRQAPFDDRESRRNSSLGSWSIDNAGPRRSRYFQRRGHTREM
jgi:hypothetical protein